MCVCVDPYSFASSSHVHRHKCFCVCGFCLRYLYLPFNAFFNQLIERQGLWFDDTLLLRAKKRLLCTHIWVEKEIERGRSRYYKVNIKSRHQFGKLKMLALIWVLLILAFCMPFWVAFLRFRSYSWTLKLKNNRPKDQFGLLQFCSPIVIDIVEIEKFRTVLFVRGELALNVYFDWKWFRWSMAVVGALLIWLADW